LEKAQDPQFGRGGGGVRKK